ncbi:unnamed protein product [Bemisia tabaci]|nr:PREDICTED: diphthine--ammonia ligase [Bemisia tabaci]CAH0393653.1 unnamed protein product [Bemisia tabaci]
MKVVALISGGKDSCYSMLQCVAAGHEIVALANLCPETKDELDSYMYQTVGHQGVELYAEAMGLPLFRKPTQGIALLHDKVYTPTPQDEVEDLFQLLEKVKKEISVEAVASGAVLSDYQRLRVENVCSRLGLVSLAYLWRRDQSELLQEMIDCNVKAIIIKVAALGLDPVKHLGMQLGEIQPHLLKMKEKYGLNVCGEGGEYETFTLDCPLFTKSVVIDDYETVIHSNDAIAPVGYLNFKQMRLVNKPTESSANLAERISLLPIKVKNAEDYLSDLEVETIDYYNEDEVDQHIGEDSKDVGRSPSMKQIDSVCNPVKLVDDPSVFGNSSGWTWFSNIVGTHEDIGTATKIALDKLCALLNDRLLCPSDLVAITLYVREMSEYANINKAYLDILNHPNPPVRICVEMLFAKETPILIEALAYKLPEGSQTPKRHTMHVQSISHWAPANIGPYSQAVRVKDTMYIAGQIALVPGTMVLIDGGIRRQARLALRHVGRLIQAMDPESRLRDVVQGVCYVTNVAHILAAKVEWERKTNNAIIDYVVVQRLPRDASVEWHLWAHRGNSRFDYEETGCCINDYRISIRRRWNYENTVATVVCYVSTGSSVSNPGVSKSSTSESNLLPISEEDLEKIIRYAIGKLLQGDQTPTDSVLSLRIFYRIDKSLELAQILEVVSQIKEFKISSSVIPVCHLHHPNTFLSIIVIKHD